MICADVRLAESWGMSARQERITFADMCAAGVPGILVYCSDYKCSHSIALMADRWPVDARAALSGASIAEVGTQSDWIN
jgi:hypothetical protein